MALASGGGRGHRLAGSNVRVSGVDLTYASREGPVHVLRGVTFDVDGGEFVCFVGPSGCGKTSLLALVAGLRRQSRGSVLVDSIEVRTAVTEIGMVFQRDLLLGWRTVIDNVLLQAEMRHLDKG